MADNQMVKIQFDFDLGNVPASVKKFNQYLKDVDLNLKTTKASAKALGDSVAQTGQQLAEAGNSVQKGNRQWTNFALILQDLPYGFRGIQNNLPAVIGSIAGAAGPLYLVASAIIAFFAAVDNGMIKLGNSVKLTTNYSKEASDAYANETVKLDSLYTVSTDVNASMSERLLAAKTLKNEYPGLLSLYSEEQITLGEADAAYKDLTKTIWQYAQAKAGEKALIEIASKKNDVAIKKNDAIAQQKIRENNLYKESKALILDEMTLGQRLSKTLLDLPKGPLMLQNAMGGVDKSSRIIADLTKEEELLNDEAAKYQVIINGNIDAESKLAAFKSTEAQKEIERAKKLKEQQDKINAEKQLRDLKSISEANRLASLELMSDQNKEIAQVEYKYGQQIALAQQYHKSTVVLEEAKAKEKADINKKYSDKQLKTDMDNAKLMNDWEAKFQIDANKRKEELDAETLKKEQESYAQRITNFKQYYDDKLGLAEGDRVAQKAILEQEMGGLISMILTLKNHGIEISSTFANVYQAWIKNNKAIADEAFAGIMKIGTGIMNALGPSLDALLEKGASLGDVLSQALSDVLKKLVKVAIAAAITVAILAALGIVDVTQIGKTFKSLFGQGMGLGNLAFPAKTATDVTGANSAIDINKPASVAGANGGTFTIKGNDLVLALQRSNSSLNLRRAD